MKNRVGQRLVQHKPALVGLVIIGLFIVGALLAPILSPHDPYFISAETMLQPPVSGFWFGTDELGRDIFSRLLYGARISLKVGLVSVALALITGSGLGLLAGYYGGWVDAVISRVMDVLMSVPDILLALAVMAILGPKTANVMLAIGIVYTPIFGRIVRGSVLELKENLYVAAARCLGVRDRVILWRHIIPGLRAPLIIQTTLSLAFAILAEAALSFLGLGVEPDVPSWGIMLSQGKDWLEQAWWIAFFPGLAITLAVLSLNLLGDGLRDALDARLTDES